MDFDLIEDDPEDLPEDPDQATAPDKPRPKANPARSRYISKRRAVASLAAKRGILSGDVRDADRARVAAKRAARKGQYKTAINRLGDAERALRAAQIDQAFVTRKLQRFNARYDRASASKKKKVAPLVQSVGAALAAGKYGAANGSLNRALGALR
jgi:chromosome segregation ATPase